MLRRVIWVAAVWAAMLALVVRMAPGAEPAVVKVSGGCSGVCVTPEGHVLTAKHCEPGAVETVTFPTLGRVVRAERVWVSPEAEGPVVFDCDGDGYPFMRVSGSVPQIGEVVHGLGYPGPDASQYRVLRGQVIGGTIGGAGPTNDVRFNVVNAHGYGGMSGGPLVNGAGQVVGLLHGTTTGAESLWITYTATRDAYDQAVLTQAQVRQRSTLVAFVTEGCAPCQQFELDRRAGKFSDFDVVIVRFDPRAGQWSHPDLYREFRETANPTGSLSAPTFWMRGTTEYRVGYTGGSRGLLGWVAGIIRAIVGGAVDLIVGGGGPDPLPTPIPEPPIEIGPPAPLPGEEEAPEVAAVVHDVLDLKARVEGMVADLKTFKDAGLVGKATMIDDLKADVAGIKGELPTLKEHAENVVEAAKADPIQFLWGLFGILSGLLHRKVEDPPDVDVED